MKMKIMIPTLIILCLTSLALIWPEQEPDTSGFSNFTVIKSHDTSIKNRRRFQVDIVASETELSAEQKAKTVMRAALDLTRKYKLDAITVALAVNPETAGTGKNLAIAHYAPDEKGFSGSQSWQWKVKTTVNNTSIWQDYLTK